MDFVIINEEIIAQEKAHLRNFWGDNPFVIAQKVWFGFGGIPLLEENMKSISAQLKMFGVEVPELFLNQRELFRLSKRMLNKNKFYRSGYINYQFYIADNKVQSVITSEASTKFDFPITEKGIFLRVARNKKSSTSELNNIKCHNQLLWQAEQTSARTSANESLVFLNENEKLCEGLETDLYLIKDNILATPAMNTGCYSDEMRGKILEIAAELNLKVIESTELNIQHLDEMDEIFLASEAKGIQWVLGFNNKRYIHEYADKIHTLLNRFLKNKVNN